MAPPPDRTATPPELAWWEFDIDDATEAGIDRAHADALADAIRQAAEHGEHVTPDMLDARIATAETRLTWRMIAVAGLVVAALRLLG